MDFSDSEADDDTYIESRFDNVFRLSKKKDFNLSLKKDNFGRRRESPDHLRPRISIDKPRGSFYKPATHLRAKLAAGIGRLTNIENRRFLQSPLKQIDYNSLKTPQKVGKDVSNKKKAKRIDAKGISTKISVTAMSFHQKVYKGILRNKLDRFNNSVRKRRFLTPRSNRKVRFQEKPIIHIFDENVGNGADDGGEGGGSRVNRYRSRRFNLYSLFRR